MAKVALIPCITYEEETIYHTVKAGLELLGGLGQFVRPEEKVLLKPNLLSKATPDKAVTTHPAVLSAVGRILREAGCAHVSYGDSPGNPAVTAEKVTDVCGLSEAASRWGIPRGNFERGTDTPYPEGRRARSFCLCEAVREAEAIINLPKMKTHALERITGAMKNLYGCVLGVNKAAGHAQFPDFQMFAEMIADLNACIKPRLHILDGIVAMEGNGPASGTPTPMNVILISGDAVALDSVFAALVHLDPADVPTVTAGNAIGLGDSSNIEVLTPDGILTPEAAQAQYGRADFDVYRGPMKTGGTMSKLRFLLPLLKARPKADLSHCVACGICEEACPVPGKAVTSGHGQKAKYDYRKCIRCYCCQEMCPAKAITVQRSPVDRLMGR